MAITNVLLLFHLLISSIARINPVSGCCSHYLEASQVIHDASQLTGLSVMGISIKKNIRAIYIVSVLSFLLTYNPGHNVLELYNILVQFQFTASKRKLDI